MKRTSLYSQERAFTLIELLTIIAIIGVLAGMAMQSFKQYRARAAYAVAEQTLNDARIALEAALSEADATYAFDLNNVSQSSPGPMADANARTLFPGLNLPKDIKITVNHDQACLSGACLASSISVRHCVGEEYVTWQRYGDGIEIKLDHVLGGGCA
ncbi:MAG: type II secretion system protein [Deltaproteobacteria bacterium]|nr:type II secretion system protein [Deltaproteobacteria bacterium]